MLYCPNYTCQAPNAESNRSCHKCHTPLPKRYLWVLGKGVETMQPGDWLSDRYLCKARRIVLDTKPGLVPTELTEVPSVLQPYLRLSPYRIHIPQLFALLPPSDRFSGGVVLLDSAALYVPTGESGAESTAAADASSGSVTGAVVQRLPALLDLWSHASALRQINWLLQISQLWQPMLVEHVAETLLMPGLIRVEGPIVRLAELRSPSSGQFTTLARLGQLWHTWAATAHPDIRTPLSALCQQLAAGQLATVEALQEALDHLLNQVGRSHPVSLHVATRTDKGPSRQRNEDACYPTADTVSAYSLGGETPSSALVIVCDGIGGHQGGDVASNLAIESVWQEMQAIAVPTLPPPALSKSLEKAALVANDLISQRNDSEQRFERQRMGTTLVTGLARHNELYIAHVGDSRAYWITRWGCHQVTLDDDVASREVRMGYGIYREALRHPGSGSLVQALGMSASSMLHPTVQRFILDEDGVFLLCTDGLSDNDRIDECWEAEILPLLDGKTDVANVSQRLIAIANSRNGHDNVTVGLLHIQVKGAAMTPTEALALAQQAQTEVVSAPSPAPSGVPITSPPPDEPAGPSRATLNLGAPATTKLLPIQRPKSPNLFGMVLGIALLLGLGGVLGYFLFPALRTLVDPLIGLTPTPSESLPTPSISPSGSSRSLNVPSLVQLRNADSTAGAGNASLILAIAPPTPVSPTPVSPTPVSPTSPSASPSASPSTVAVAGVLPLGSTAIVRQKLRVADEFWVELQVCQGNAATLSPVSPTSPAPGITAPSVAPSALPAPTGNPPSFRALQAGDSGWIRETEITPFVVSNTPANRLSEAQRSACGDIPATNPTLSGTEISWLGDRILL